MKVPRDWGALQTCGTQTSVTEASQRGGATNEHHAKETFEGASPGARATMPRTFEKTRERQYASIGTHKETIRNKLKANKTLKKEMKRIVFEKGSNEFVHPDGGRQKVYSNLVYYPEKLLWNPNVIDPELKQQALEHCLGLSLGPRPSKRVSRDEREPGCTRSGSVSQCSNTNTSL